MIFSDFLRERRRHRLTLKFPQHREIFARPPEGETICLDTETSGLNPNKDDLLAIGAVLIKNNRIIYGQRLDIKVRPSSLVTQESIRIHGIRNHDLQDALPVNKALEQLLNFMGQRPILGYWIRFDMKLLSRLSKTEFGFKLPNKTIELSDIYQHKIRRQHPDEQVDIQFDSMAKNLNIDVMDRHSALGDALTTALMYLRLKKGVRPSTLP